MDRGCPADTRALDWMATLGSAGLLVGGRADDCSQSYTTPPELGPVLLDQHSGATPEATVT